MYISICMLLRKIIIWWIMNSLNIIFGFAKPVSIMKIQVQDRQYNKHINSIAWQCIMWVVSTINNHSSLAAYKGCSGEIVGFWDLGSLKKIYLSFHVILLDVECVCTWNLFDACISSWLTTEYWICLQKLLFLKQTVVNIAVNKINI